MNTDRARAKFSAVEHHVISQRPYLSQRRPGITGGIETGFELGHVVVVQRSERMMGRIPAPGLPVPFEHGEISHPEETKISCGISSPGKSPMLGLIFLGEVQPKLATRLEKLVRTLLGVGLTHHQQPQISRLDFSGFENCLQRMGIVPGKAIGISHQTYG